MDSPARSSSRASWTAPSVLKTLKDLSLVSVTRPYSFLHVQSPTSSPKLHRESKDSSALRVATASQDFHVSSLTHSSSPKHPNLDCEHAASYINSSAISVGFSRTTCVSRAALDPPASAQYLRNSLYV